MGSGQAGVSACRHARQDSGTGPEPAGPAARRARVRAHVCVCACVCVCVQGPVQGSLGPGACLSSSSTMLWKVPGLKASSACFVRRRCTASSVSSLPVASGARPWSSHHASPTATRTRPARNGTPNPPAACAGKRARMCARSARVGRLDGATMAPRWRHATRRALGGQDGERAALLPYWRTTMHRSVLSGGSCAAHVRLLLASSGSAISRLELTCNRAAPSSIPPTSTMTLSPMVAGTQAALITAPRLNHRRRRATWAAKSSPRPPVALGRCQSG